MAENKPSLPASIEPPSLVTTSESSSKNDKQSVLVAPNKRKGEIESSASGSNTPNPPALTTIKPVGSVGNNINPPASKKPALEQRYDEFLKMITEIGKDVKPAYTNSKIHADRLKRNITTARGILRECLGELDRLSRQDSQQTNVTDTGPHVQT